MLVLEKVLTLDQIIANNITVQSSIINWFAWAITLSVIMFIAAALCYWWTIKKDKKTCLKLAVGSIALYVTLEIIKRIVARPRPSSEDNLSFPSRHVALAFMLALFLPISKKLKVLLLVWASLVAVSRLLLGKHWLSDILIGGVIGAVAALLLSKWKI